MIKGERRLLIIDVGGNVRAQMPIGNAKVRDLGWIDDLHVSVTHSATEYIGQEFSKSTMEFYAVTVIPLDDTKPWTVFGNTDAMAHAEFGQYGYRTLDGHPYGYFAGLEFKKSFDGTSYEFDHGEPSLFAVDMVAQTLHRLAKPALEGAERSWLVDANGKLAATLEIQHQSGAWTLNSGTGATLARGKDLTASVDLVALSQDGSAIILSKRDPASGDRRWFKTPIAGGEPVAILDDVNIERIYTDRATGRMIGYLPKADDGPAVPVLFDAEKQERLRKVYRAFPKLRVEVQDFTADLGRILVRTSGNTDPGSWYLVDLAVRRADPVGDERPQIPYAQIGAISTITYKAADGLEMSGILTLPPGRAPKNLPVIMLPHGGPHAHDEAEFDWWAQALASRGYAVFQPNFRGSTNRNAAFVRAGDGEWGRKMQTDISDGLAELAHQGIVDPKRACIVGASYGGYAALAGVTLQKGLYRCAVAVAPVSDISEMYYTDIEESADDPLTKRLLKQQLGDPSGFNAVSPRRHAADADAPILLIHGKDDTVVPFRQSDRMAAALRDAHKPVDFVVMQKEDHWLSRSETRQQMLEACVGFVLKNNPPD